MYFDLHVRPNFVFLTKLFGVFAVFGNIAELDYFNSITLSLLILKKGKSLDPGFADLEIYVCITSCARLYTRNT